MKIHDVVQGSVDWLLLRSGIPTASEWDALITPLGKIRTGDGVKTYLNKKLAEWWLGGPISTFYGGGMEQGNILEEEARPFYTALTGEKIRQVGFITNDEGTFGCSPDGLIEDGGIEIKSPEVHTHVGFLLNKELPKDYFAQVHGSMHVTGAKWWKFFSYRRGLPPFIIKVDRDEAIQETLADALFQFNEYLEDAKNQLIVINGGPPKRGLSPMKPKERRPESAFVSEMPS